jgi:hypothetical protein
MARLIDRPNMFDQQAIETSLRITGITVRDYWWTSPELVSDAAWMFAACLDEDGRVDRIFDLDEPGLIGKANDAWWELVIEYDLLDQDRNFLVSVGPLDEEIPTRSHWARVRFESGSAQLHEHNAISRLSVVARRPLAPK